MIDINIIRTNKELVKENIKKKFQDEKLPLVDSIYDMDIKYRKIKTEADEDRSKVNTLSKEIGSLMRDKKVEEANKIKEEVSNIKKIIPELEKEEALAKEKEKMESKKVEEARTVEAPRAEIKPKVNLNLDDNNDTDDDFFDDFFD